MYSKCFLHHDDWNETAATPFMSNTLPTTIWWRWAKWETNYLWTFISDHACTHFESLFWNICMNRSLFIQCPWKTNLGPINKMWIITKLRSCKPHLGWLVEWSKHTESRRLWLTKINLGLVDAFTHSPACGWCRSCMSRSSPRDTILSLLTPGGNNFLLAYTSIKFRAPSFASLASLAGALRGRVRALPTTWPIFTPPLTPGVSISR